MGDWRRGFQGHQYKQPGGGYRHYEGKRGGIPPRCSSRRPPSSGNSPPTVPSWEKEFCFYVGQIPWRMILEAKNLMPLYKNIAQWDDSAGEEAFHNAKARYWAHINGLPCDIPVPDPDMFLDEINWNFKVDPELILDLEKKPPPPPSNDEWNSGHLRSGWDLALEQIVPTGWVSTEDPHAAPGWEDWERKDDTGNNGWDSSAGWGDGALHSSSGGSKEDKAWARWENFGGNKDDSQQKWDNSKADTDHHYPESRRYSKKREVNNNGWYGSSNANSKYKGGDIGRYSNNRNCRGRRRMNYSNEYPLNDKEPLARWQWKSLHPPIVDNCPAKLMVPGPRYRENPIS